MIKYQWPLTFDKDYCIAFPMKLVRGNEIISVTKKWRRIFLGKRKKGIEVGRGRREFYKRIKGKYEEMEEKDRDRRRKKDGERLGTRD